MSSLRLLIFLSLFVTGFVIAVRAPSDPAPNVTSSPPSRASAPTPKPQSKPRASLSDSLRGAFDMAAGEGRARALALCAEELAKLDPESALEMLLSQPSCGARDKALLTAFQRLLDQDLAKGMDWLEKQPFFAHAAKNIIYAQLGKLAESDGAKAWGYFERWHKLFAAADAGGLIDSWVRRRPEEAVAQMLAISSREDRVEFTSKALSRWLTNDLKGFVAWLKKQPQDSMQLYLVGLSAVPRDATWQELSDLGQAMPYEALKNSNWVNLVRFAIRDDADLANSLRVIRGFPDAELRDQSWLGLVRATAPDDPRAARVYLSEIADSRVRCEAASEIAAHLAHDDLKAGFEMAQSETDPLAQEGALRSVIYSLMSQHPEEGVAYLQEHIGELSKGLIELIGPKVWKSKDPRSIANWTTTLADESQRRQLWESASSWIDEKPQEVINWALSQSNRANADEALIRMTTAAMKYATFKPESLTRGIAVISSPSLRRQAAETLLKRWNSIDADAARRWLDTEVSNGRLESIRLTAPTPVAVASERTGSLQTKHSHVFVEGTKTYRYQSNGVEFDVFY